MTILWVGVFWLNYIRLFLVRSSFATLENNEYVFPVKKFS